MKIYRTLFLALNKLVLLFLIPLHLCTCRLEEPQVENVRIEKDNAEAISDLTYYESLIECIPVNILMDNPECSNIKPGDIFGGLFDRYNEALN